MLISNDPGHPGLGIAGVAREVSVRTDAGLTARTNVDHEGTVDMESLGLLLGCHEI